MSPKNARKKTLRYFRWLVKVAVLLILILPIRYFSHPGVYTLPVSSLIFGGLNNPLFYLPYGQSACVFLLFSWTSWTPGEIIICPIGGLEILLTRGILPQSGLNIGWLTLTLISGVLFFFFLTFLLGSVFCSWVCPLGTIVDGFDKAVERFMPKINMKREERLKRNSEKSKNKSTFACPTCPFGKFLANKNAIVANGLLVSAFVGSAILRFPVWCALCPIGILSQGMFHLKAITRISKTLLPVVIELWIIPVVALLLSLREKRYWCRKVCPLGALVKFFARFNPFFKPTVKVGKRVMKEDSKTGEDHHLPNCVTCTRIDKRRCEKVCPQGIGPLRAKGSAECTKCLECYVECSPPCSLHSIKIKWFRTPDAVLWLKRFFKKLRRRIKKQKS